ncbi:hypothetical protein [Streptomyces sp. st77]|uniref:hypothetical protein n=1 Tax=Streptomyces sp. st77 TaxID=1828074 RepID=UPI000BFE0B90|nr:hypothetical protein [Streptomyces sp. st77]
MRIAVERVRFPPPRTLRFSAGSGVGRAGNWQQGAGGTAFVGRTISGLVDVEPYQIGRYLHLRCVFETVDAAGQNMTTAAIWQILRRLTEAVADDDALRPVNSLLEGNLSGDKKAAVTSLLAGRGTRVTAECRVRRDAVTAIVKTTPEAMVKSHVATVLGAQQAGMVGCGVNAANIVAAQDHKQVLKADVTHGPESTNSVRGKLTGAPACVRARFTAPLGYSERVIHDRQQRCGDGDQRFRLVPAVGERRRHHVRMHRRARLVLDGKADPGPPFVLRPLQPVFATGPLPAAMALDPFKRATGLQDRAFDVVVDVGLGLGGPGRSRRRRRPHAHPPGGPEAVKHRPAPPMADGGQHDAVRLR